MVELLVVAQVAVGSSPITHPIKKTKGHCNTAMAFVPFAPVAQLDRAPDFESVGRPFESGRAYQLFQGFMALCCKPFFCLGAYRVHFVMKVDIKGII